MRTRGVLGEGVLPKVLRGIGGYSTKRCECPDVGSEQAERFLGVFQRPLTLILLQKYRDTNGRRIVIQIGGVYTTFC